MGTLRIRGVIDISQFWPKGSSDADTTKIKLLVTDNAFSYRPEPGGVFSKTGVYFDAISKGQGSKSVVATRKKDGTQTVTIRLQGVDAPELHFKAAPLKRSNEVTDVMRSAYNETNEERRQCFAESATFALAKYLRSFANRKGLIPAIFQSEVENPADVVDTYGRFVGNVLVGDNFDQDINIWLVENGWGMPAFYTSMSDTEIQLFLAAWNKGKKKNGRTSKAVARDANVFDWDLVYRKPDDELRFKLGDDRGRVLMPKIFRRQVAWLVKRKTGVISRSTGFQAYLRESPDQLLLLSDLLEKGQHAAKVYALHDFVTADNRVERNPEDLVFREKPGILVDSKGRKITKW